MNLVQNIILTRKNLQSLESMNQKIAINEDHVCAICLTVYLYPVEISTCKHIFCRSCLEDSAQLSGERKCPLCRGQYRENKIEQKLQLWEEIKNFYPDQVKSRLRNIKERRTVRLVVGNTTKKLNVNQGNQYDWEMYVKQAEGESPLNQLAKKIELKLHETFHPNRVIYNLKSMPVSLRRIGWGTFRIYGKVEWNEGFQEKVSEFHYDLRFSPKSEKEVAFILHKKQQAGE